MTQPMRLNPSVVRTYAARLRTLMVALAVDPLDEDKSLALITHIVDNRETATTVMASLDADLA